MRAPKTAGLTFMEVIVYTALLTVISVYAITVILGMVTAFAKAKTLHRLTLDGETALERISREVRLASAVDDASSVLGTNSSRLSLDTVKSEADSTPANKDFVVSGGRIALQEDAGPIQYLISPGASTTAFLVTKITTPRAQAVKIVLTLQAGSGQNLISRSFYNTIILRQSYP